MNEANANRADHVPDPMAVLAAMVVWNVQSQAHFLSVHQLAVLFVTDGVQGPHTVRGLAAYLNVTKSIITRAADRLGELGLCKRLPDPQDRRSVLLVSTKDGAAYVEQLGWAGARAAA